MSSSLDAMHKKTIELLPWYVNGTLSADEHAEVESHLGACIPCRAALEEERRLRGLIRSQEDIPLSAEHGISDLMRQIDGGSVAMRRQPMQPRFVTAIAAACIAVVVAVVLLRVPGVEQISGEFTTLTNSPATTTNHIDIVLSDGVDESQILSVIEEFGGTVVEGPSELGRFTVAVRVGEAVTTQDVIDSLAQDPRVRFVGRNFIAAPSGSEEER